jgi:hypothetical protein
LKLVSILLQSSDFAIFAIGPANEQQISRQLRSKKCSTFAKERGILATAYADLLHMLTKCPSMQTQLKPDELVLRECDTALYLTRWSTVLPERSVQDEKPIVVQTLDAVVRAKLVVTLAAVLSAIRGAHA